MKRFPKRYVKLVASATAILGIFAVYFIVNAKQTGSRFTISASENKFKAEFNLTKLDQNFAQSFLEKANVPQSVLNGFEFTLDGTSSAKLAYISPIITDLKILKDKVDFTGTAKTALIYDKYQIKENFKAPDSTTIALFGGNLLPFLKTMTNPQYDLTSWFDENVKSTSGMYLILFGEKPDFALIYPKGKDPDFDKIKAVEDVQDDTTYHIVQNYVFFEENDMVFITSSPDSAKEIAKLQKERASSIFSNSSNVSFAMVLKNSPDDNNAETASKFLMGDEQKITDYISKIKNTGFYLTGNNFNGSVEL